MQQHVYTIRKEDVGNRTMIKVNRVSYSVYSIMGTIQCHDVGKRIYYFGNGVLQVENQKQLIERVGTLCRNMTSSMRQR